MLPLASQSTISLRLLVVFIGEDIIRILLFVLYRELCLYIGLQYVYIDEDLNQIEYIEHVPFEIFKGVNQINHKRKGRFPTLFARIHNGGYNARHSIGFQHKSIQKYGEQIWNDH